MATGDMSKMYREGKSIAEVAAAMGLPKSTVRGRLLRLGVELRSRSEAGAIVNPKSGAARRGVKRGPMSAEQRWKLSVAHSNKPARGTRITPSGYVEHTRGPHKGRLVHVVKMEQAIGRHLQKGECVHHIDHNKQNNEAGNLMLTTLAEHTRIHRAGRSTKGVR